MAILIIARAMPVDCSKLSDKQNEMINNAIGEVKVTAKERWQHIANYLRNKEYAAIFKEKFSRVLSADGLAKIYDLTKNKIVGIGKCAEHKGRIYLDGRAINTPDNYTIMFDREHHTDYALVTEENGSTVKIFEQEMARVDELPLLNLFEVDPNKLEFFVQTNQCKEGCSHTSVEPVHLIKEIPAHLSTAWGQEATQSEGKKEE